MSEAPEGGWRWDFAALRACVEAHYPILYLVTFEDEECDKYIRALADGRRIF